MLATAENPGTSAVANRIRLLDVLRGVTILGMLGTNTWLFSTVARSRPGKKLSLLPFGTDEKR